MTKPPVLIQQRYHTNLSSYASELDAIAEADYLARTAVDTLHSTVATARAAGATWEAIGSILGSSRQAAQQRFG